MAYIAPVKLEVLLTPAQQAVFDNHVKGSLNVRTFTLFRLKEKSDLSLAELIALIKTTAPFPLAHDAVVEHAAYSALTSWRVYLKGKQREPVLPKYGAPVLVRVCTPAIGSADKDGFESSVLPGRVTFALPGALDRAHLMSSISLKKKGNKYITHIVLRETGGVPISEAKEEYI